MEEVRKLENTITKLTGEGKKVFLFPVPPVPVATSSKERKDARAFLNGKLLSIVNVIKSKKQPGPGNVTLLQENDGNFNSATDYTDEKHLSPLAMEKRISQLDELLPNDNKLKTSLLGEHPTCDPYRGCYGTYPVGCMYCTKISHNETECPLKGKTKKRNLSSESQEQGGKGKVTKIGGK